MPAPRGPAAVVLRAVSAIAALALAVVVARVAPPQLALAAAVLAVPVFPGWALVRVARLDDALGGATALAVAPAAGLVAWALALALGVVVGLSLDVLLVLVTGGALALFAWRGSGIAWSRRTPRTAVAVASCAGAAVLVGVLGARWQVGMAGDALFHAGRVRKLLALPDLSLSGLSAYDHGALHAGYPFPVLHAAEAAAIRLTGIEPTAAYSDLAPVFAVAVASAGFTAGRALGGALVGSLAGLLYVWDALTRSDGPLGYAQQPASFTFLVLFPLALALLVMALRDGGDRRATAPVLTAVALVLLVHITYAVPLVAMMATGALAAGRGLRLVLAASAMTLVGFAAVYAAALAGASRAAGRTVSDGGYALWNGHAIVLAEQTVLRDRPHVMLAIVAVPVLLLAGRGRHGMAAALAAGSLALVALPFVTTILVEVVGAGQTRRFAAGVPWPLAAAVAIALAASAMSPAAVMAAAVVLAAASLALATGDLPSNLELVAICVCAAAAAVVLLMRAACGRRMPSSAPLAAVWPGAAILVIALLAGGFHDRGSDVLDRLRDGTSAARLSDQVALGLVAFLRHHDASLPVVLAPADGSRADGYSGIAYQLVGNADVYTVAISEAHSRAEPKNDPAQRRRNVRQFFAPGTSDARRSELLRRYGVEFVVANRDRQRAVLPTLRAMSALEQVYEDERFVVFRVRSSQLIR
jgi:hypothetical protein